MKRCSVCCEEKAFSEFYLAAGHPCAACKECYRRRQKEAKAKRPARAVPPMPPSPTCAKCGVRKSSCEFYRFKDGRRPICKVCYNRQRDELAARRPVIKVTAKKCTTCKIVKPIREFHTHKTSLDRRYARCKTCRGQYTSARRRDPGEGDKWRNNSLRFRYGISLAEYNTMWDAQNGRCAICKRLESEIGSSKRLSVDHNHETGRVRMLLCNGCNSLIGYADEDISRLENAAQYLREA